MIVNEFESSNAYRLQQIVSTLKNVHGYELDLDSRTNDEISALAQSSEIVKNSIVKESAFNSWMQNPEYTKNMLILEAAKIYLAEIAPKRLNKKKKVKEGVEGNDGDYHQYIWSNDDHDSEEEWHDKDGNLDPNGAYDAGGHYHPERAADHIDEGPRGLSRSGRDWALNKMSQDPKGAFPKPYKQPHEKPKGDVRGELEDLMQKYLGQGGKVQRMAEDGMAETAPSKVLSMAKLGRDMMDYAQRAPRGVDDRELRVLNAISQVGDKLTQFGTPFGPRTLTDLDKKVIEVAKRRLGMKPEVAEDGTQPPKPGSMTMTKDGVTTMIPPEKVQTEVPKLAAQGFKPETTIKETKMTKDLHKLTKKKDELEHKMDKIVDGGGKVLRTDPLRVEYEKVVADIRKAKTGKLEEAHHMEVHDDYQASMARSELYRNTKYAMDMMKMISPEDDVKPWIAANLANAAMALDKIYHYMDYYTTFEKDDTMPSMAAPTTVDEDADESCESTGGVARQNLLMIMEYSTKLFRMIQPGDRLEGWVAMKLTTASENISSSKHYLDYAQFERHVGHEMSQLDATAEMPELETEPMPVEEEVKTKKKTKKKVKETIGTMLMTMMLNEEQDLAQAQTLLAAKAMSDDLQGIAEKLAKMSVEDLMPLVDIMKEQFGQEQAEGFNGTVKGALEAVLNAATEAKETTDNAVLSLQGGQVPGTGATDIEAAAPEAPEGEDEFGGMAAAAGPEGEPLGRAKKPEAGEEAAPESLEEAKKAKPDFLDLDKDGNKKEPMKKAAADKKKAEAKNGKKVDEGKLKEVAPPGKKAEDFIKKSKADFKKRYGDRWQEVLYATAWKKFGKKEESTIRTAKMLEAAKANRTKLVRAFESHRAKHARMVNEGLASDVTNVGYGLEGQSLLDQITDVDGMISRLKEMLGAEMRSGMQEMRDQIQAGQRASALESRRDQAPWGVLWKDERGAKCSRFFETEDMRRYWMGLNQASLQESRLVDPQDWDARIKALNAKRG